ncbi:MAG TPA: phospho-sugar mutase [Saprospiraceae bacterium]|nr:phospho-sugar mutase [Saprospiraceae bacterium]HRP42256.1 phospho-sugar mutase [Saprospiraceae bacterium]
MDNLNIDQQIKANIEVWLDGNYDEATKTSIQQLIAQGDEKELTDAFYKNLEFGTGGLRGIMGAGSNRVNKYTLGAATQGFSNYLNNLYSNIPIKVAVSCDSRNNSALFASVVAGVFSANNIKVYFFESMRPTPELSFAIRHLGCQGGVMLTASHNPKEYNGYKAYGADGGQLVFPHDEAVMQEVAKVQSIDDILFDHVNENIEIIGTDIDRLYMEAIKKVSVSKDAIARQKDLKIVYSPLHGTGSQLVPPALKHFGFENVIPVEAQMIPDGNFPTVIYPNPEEAEAMSMALTKGKDTDADIIMATDPDADRVGIAIKNKDGQFILLNGNQALCLLTNYVLSSRQKAGKLDNTQYIMKTIVTSYMIDKIAASKGVDCYNVLTGFKYIGEVMTELEGKKTFLLGGEESYGYLIGDHARDKDAVVACCMFAEMAAWYKDQGKSMYDALIALYEEYGFYKEKLISITKKGKEGSEEIRAMMDNFRNNTPTTLGNNRVIQLKDYKSGISTDILTGKTEKINLPSSNVLQFYTEDGSIISARPSGTEPKIKFYCSVQTTLKDAASFESTEAELDQKLEGMLNDLGVGNE